MEYLVSAVNFVPFNPWVLPSPRIKISFFLVSTCTEELKSTPKIITLEPNPPVGNEKIPQLSNLIPGLEYLHSLILTFFANCSK